MAKVQRGTNLNFSDIPEMLLGARPGANPAQRQEFERRSRMLHREDVEEHTQLVTTRQAAAGVGITSTQELEAMFPTLDAAIVRSIRADSPSAQHALDTLLALAACQAEPGGGIAVGKPTDPPEEMPKWEVGLEDHNQFPSLIDADGWQCVSGTKLQEGEKDPGSAWRDRANAAKDKPAPETKAESVAWGPKKKQGRQMADEYVDQIQPYTDYDCRHRAGERRAKQRVQYSRGRGSGLSCRGRGRGAGGDLASGSKESEEEFDPTDV